MDIRLKYSIGRESWLCSNIKNLPKFLSEWSVSKSDKITGDLEITYADQCLSVFNKANGAAMSLLDWEKEDLNLFEQLLDDVVKMIKTVLKAKKPLQIYIFKDLAEAVNSIINAGSEEKNYLCVVPGLMEEVKINLNQKNISMSNLQIGEAKYPLYEISAMDEKFDPLFKKSMEWLADFHMDHITDYL